MLWRRVVKMPISARAGLSMHDQLLLIIINNSRLARDPPEAHKTRHSDPMSA
jgi:hypothetical protein